VSAKQKKKTEKSSFVALPSVSAYFKDAIKALLSFTEASVNFLQQPCNNLPRLLEHCSGAAGEVLHSSWSNLPKPLCKNNKHQTVV